MIPNTGFGSMYVKIIGENALFTLAQNNLLNHLERTSKTRTHTFLANNGQTEYGISNNFGALRCYSWGDTTIDCRNAPGLSESDFSEHLATLSENRRFQKVKENLEQRMGGLISVEPFFSVLLGKDNMRYNICRAAKIEDFDIIRVGMALEAPSEECFSRGLAHLKDSENPFKMKKMEIMSQLAYQ